VVSGPLGRDSQVGKTRESAAGPHVTSDAGRFLSSLSADAARIYISSLFARRQPSREHASENATPAGGADLFMTPAVLLLPPL